MQRVCRAKANHEYINYRLLIRLRLLCSAGKATNIFSVVETIMLKPLDFMKTQNIVVVALIMAILLFL